MEEGGERPLDGNEQLLLLYRQRLLDMRTQLQQLTQLRIMKFPRVFQTAFYYFGITQAEINEEGTNKLDWKKAKKYVNENFFIYITYLDPLGSKEYDPPIYAKIENLQKNIQDLDAEAIEEFSLSLAMLYRFLTQCFIIRKQDARLRRENVAQLREERYQAIQAHEELENKRRSALEEARAQHEKEQQEIEDVRDREEFEEEKFLEEFAERESNQPIEIPPEIPDEIDNDLLE